MSPQVRAVLFVFVAEVLQNVAVWNQELSDLHRDRPEVHFGVVNGHLEVDMAKIAAVKALLNPQSFAPGMSETVQAPLVIESRGVYDQRIAFPMPNGIAQPRRLGIGGKFSPICVYLPVRVIHLVKD